MFFEMAGLEEYQPTAASDQEFQNLNLTTRVQAALKSFPSISLVLVESPRIIAQDSGFVFIL